MMMMGDGEFFFHTAVNETPPAEAKLIHSSAKQRVKTEGRVSVQADCKLEQDMPKGTMCWLQGASGVIYADRFDSTHIT